MTDLPSDAPAASAAAPVPPSAAPVPPAAAPVSPASATVQPATATIQTGATAVPPVAPTVQQGATAVPPVAPTVQPDASPIPPAGVPSAPSSSLPPVSPRAFWVTALAVVLLCVAAAVVAWMANQRVRDLERELVRRQQDAGAQSAEAVLLARQASEATRDSTAKLALLEARLAEVTLQRSQLEELLQALARSRDENMLVDIDAGLRVAMQQAAITGTGEPLVAALRQADERLQRHAQPRLEGVRRAIARDLDRVRAAAIADLPTLGIKLDEALRLIDDAPLLSVAEPRRAAAPAESKPVPPAAAASADGWGASVQAQWRQIGARIWDEVRSLVRVTRVDQPEAMLLAPENAFFLRENLKLRLLNARLALFSRQFDTAQSDLQSAQQYLDRYFDRTSRRTTMAGELIKQVAAQARHVAVPRPDETLAALATAAAGR